MKVIKDISLIKEKLKEIDLKSIFQKNLEEDMELIFFDKDEIIYNQGDELKGIYILASGEIKVYFSLSNGKENILRKLKAPRIFGEIEFMMEAPSPSSVQTLEPSYCFYLPLKKYREELLNDLFFLRNIAYNLSEAIYKSNIKASMNQGVPPKNRVVAYIFNIEKENIFICNTKEISEFIGISERHVFRIFNELIQGEYIIKEKNFYRILKRESLKELVEELYI